MLRICTHFPCSSSACQIGRRLVIGPSTNTAKHRVHSRIWGRVALFSIAAAACAGGTPTHHLWQRRLRCTPQERECTARRPSPCARLVHTVISEGEAFPCHPRAGDYHVVPIRH